MLGLWRTTDVPLQQCISARGYFMIPDPGALQGHYHVINARNGERGFNNAIHVRFGLESREEVPR